MMTAQILKLQSDKEKLLEDKAKLQNENQSLEQKNKGKDKTIDTLKTQIEQQKPILDQKDRQIQDLKSSISKN